MQLKLGRVRQSKTAPPESIPISQIKIKDKTSKLTARNHTSCSQRKQLTPLSHQSLSSSSARLLGLSPRRYPSSVSYPSLSPRPKTGVQNRKTRVNRIAHRRFKIKLTKSRIIISQILTPSTV